jgi:hypothetical protein
MWRFMDATYGNQCNTFYEGGTWNTSFLVVHRQVIIVDLWLDFFVESQIWGTGSPPTPVTIDSHCLGEGDDVGEVKLLF